MLLKTRNERRARLTGSDGALMPPHVQRAALLERSGREKERGIEVLLLMATRADADLDRMRSEL